MTVNTCQNGYVYTGTTCAPNCPGQGLENIGGWTVCGPPTFLAQALAQYQGGMQGDLNNSSGGSTTLPPKQPTPPKTPEPHTKPPSSSTDAHEKQCNHISKIRGAQMGGCVIGFVMNAAGGATCALVTDVQTTIDMNDANCVDDGYTPDLTRMVQQTY